MNRINEIFEKDKSLPIISEEDKIELMIEHFLSTGPPVIKNKRKDASRALELIKSANDSFKLMRSMYLITMYTEAIMNAPIGSPELARGFASRSAALCNARLFEDSLKDIDRAMAIGYPDHLKGALYLRRAKNLLSLDPKMRPEVQEAIAEARRLMDKVDVDSEKKIDKALKKLRQKDSFSEPYKKWDSHKFLPPVPNDNPLIPRASGGIALNYNEEFGRHVIATRDIKAGETLILAKAYVSAVKVDKMAKFCWYCLQRTWASVPCNLCINVVFCSEECRDKAWNEYHDIECRFLTAIKTENVDPTDILSIKMTIKAVKEAGSLEKLKEQVDMLDSMTDKINSNLNKNVFDDTRYETVCIINRDKLNHKEAIADVARSVELLYYLMKSTKMFGKKIVNLQKPRNNQWVNFMLKLIFRHKEISHHAVELRVRKAEDHAPIRSYILIPLYGFLNHSCDPNFHKMTSGDMNALISTRYIKKGEQIFMNYGSRFQMMDKWSRAAYLERHNFKCHCIPCVNNWGPNSKLPSFMEQPLPITAKQFLAVIALDASQHVSKFYDDNLNVDRREKPDSYFLECINKFKGFLNFYGGIVSYPCQEIEDCKQALTDALKLVDDHSL
ncbi:Similar to SMYD4: SET and MYND domain-containing protein 4 (Gallus gallus) [Cotesia congregata]|uniref:Similar to SMYD4: SET and MYND domain-containing protein 4 (Gallus gallus) n=1 Tax=Cotesia congregata TaxID=51543 RepID=A0A8J2MQ14_COTCN|nr:Similar to SMYD4: SET and MYND domain-containing protein 4 (Gallus gallus) [Cotesia congregata]